MKLFVTLILVSIGVISGRVHHRSGANAVGKNPNKHYLLKHNRIPKERVVDEGPPEASLFDACAECKTLVQEIDTIIDDQSKIEEMKMILNLVCDALPSEYKDECKNLVQNLDVLIHKLRPLLKDPQAFCTEIHLCGGGMGSGAAQVLLGLAKLQINRLTTGSRQRGGALCDECKFAVTELETLLKQKTIQDELKVMLEQLCNYLGNYKDECVTLIDTYFPMLIQELLALLGSPEQVCAELGLCNTRTLTVHALQLFPPSKGRVTLHRSRESHLLRFFRRMGRIQTRMGKNTGCTICLYSVDALLETVKNDPQILESWAAGLENVCKVFPTELQPGCDDFLGIYLEPALRVTVDSVTSREVCDMVHACSATKFEAAILHHQTGRVNSEIACESCKLLAEFLKTELGQQSVQDELKEELKQVCNFVPGKYVDQCDEIVNDYVPYAINLLLTELDPNTLCPELRLCSPHEIDEDRDASSESIDLNEI
jgi:saposin